MQKGLSDDHRLLGKCEVFQIGLQVNWHLCGKHAALHIAATFYMCL